MLNLGARASCGHAYSCAPDTCWRALRKEAVIVAFMLDNFLLQFYSDSIVNNFSLAWTRYEYEFFNLISERCYLFFTDF